ncbi:MAG: aminomethyltransferase family protein [Blastocatellia bacterium]
MMNSLENAIKRSPLYDAQKELGAQFTNSNGREMAQVYRDPNREVQQVRQAVGLIDLSHHGAIKIGGTEAVQFLNGLVTNDMKTLKKGEGMRAAFLTAHGKVEALCRIFNLGGEYLVITDPQTHEKVFKYIFPFSYAGDFQVEDVSDQYQLLSVQGPKSLLVMKEACFEPVPSLAEYGWLETIIGGQHVLVTRSSHTGETGFDILAPASGLKDVWDFILLKGSFHSILPVGLAALNSLRIEAGIPVYGADIDESNMMLETGISDAVSFTKGCYKGQEAVVMATHRGHISKKLSGLIMLDGEAPSPGSKITKDGKEIGRITSAIQSETLEQAIALAYLKYGYFDQGNVVEVVGEQQSFSAKVVDLPFYRPVTG